MTYSREQHAAIGGLVSEVKVIYTDVDGTLLGPGGCLFLSAKREFTLIPAQTIVSVLKRGIDIVMVSGRNREQLKEDARVLGFKNFISELGAEIVYDLGKRIVPNIVDFKVTQPTVFETIAKRGAPKALFEHYRGKLEYHTPWQTGRNYTHLLRGYVNVDEADKFLATHGFANLKLVDNGRISTTSPTLKVREVHAYHLLPKSIDKASALRLDQKERKIKKDETIAIGDSWADLPLASEVGVLFIVANGVREDGTLARKINEYDNIFVTREEKGLGWAEAVNLVL
ncbi:MAG: HAD family hydrolase [Actinomycetota bacterium]